LPPISGGLTLVSEQFFNAGLTPMLPLGKSIFTTVAENGK
jgi:hypothetical protein